MKYIKVPLTPASFVKMNKIEVYGSLSEKFGSMYNLPEMDSDEEHKMNFQLDRLFSVIHYN